MKKVINLCALATTIILAGCSSAPKEVEAPFKYEDKIVEFTLETSVNDGEVNVDTIGQVHFMPNYAVTPYVYSNMTTEANEIYYRFKEGIVDKQSCIDGAGTCHTFKFTSRDGVNLAIVYLSDNIISYTFDHIARQNPSLESDTKIQLPTTHTSSASGTFEMKEKGTISETYAVMKDGEGKESAYKTVLKYRVVEQ